MRCCYVSSRCSPRGKSRDLPQGEYRSHLVFQTVPPTDVGEDIETEGLEAGQLQVRLIATFAIAIPVIVRHGDLSASLTLSELKLDPPSTAENPPVLFLRLNRGGDRSVYGDLSVTFKAEGGAATEVGRVSGIAVYTPNASRTLRLPLRPPEGVTLKRGRLGVVFRESDEQPGAVHAEAEIAVP